ncbi:MAG: class I SAM-dependent methyltransferase [Fimbriimonas sp.]|nr:class I SAM-dependent methyltransferase [Fimbriimonas sp.]
MERYALSELVSVVSMGPSEWRTWEKIPWDDEAFSERMLAEHLDQGHDLASRSLTWIESACKWIHEDVMHGRGGRILDLGCGPGLYAERLAALGHKVTGIDFAPAAIRYARERVPDADFRLGDMRSIEYGSGYDLVMLLFGEIGPFCPEERRSILARAAQATVEDGLFVLEVHRPEPLREACARPSTWSSRSSGLFSPDPHLMLSESDWWDEESAAAFRTVIVTSREVMVAREAVAALSIERWIESLSQSGWILQAIGPALGPGDKFVTIVARKPGK